MHMLARLALGTALTGAMCSAVYADPLAPDTATAPAAQPADQAAATPADDLASFHHLFLRRARLVRCRSIPLAPA